MTPAPTFLAQEDEIAAKIAACGEDVAKLEALATSFEEADDKASARKAYERILEIDENHEAAHKALRHHNYDGKWFTSYAALSKYRREEAKRMKEEFGLVRYQDEWVPEKDLPFIRLGWTKEGDTYVNPAVASRRAERAEMEDQGYQLRQEDSVWVSPDDFQKWTDGLYKCGDNWVSKEEANTYHSEIGQWWNYRSPNGKFIARTTNNVDDAAWVVWWAEQTYPDLVRIFGVEPEEPPVFACLNSLAQYNNFAAGDQNAQRQATESTGFSSCHFAYLGDLWFDLSNPQQPEYIGGGVTYYDTEGLKGWGQFSVRHAAGLSYAESIDHAWDTISQFLSGQAGGGANPNQVWEEKQIPRWLVYGAASYVERYMEDKSNDGNPWAWREWSISELAKDGKLVPIETILQLTLDLNDIEGSTRLIHQAGLVTAFMLDGGCKPVTAAHEEFKQALKAGDTEKAVAQLNQAIIDNQAALAKFSGLEIATQEEIDAAREAAAAAAAAAAPATTDGADSGADSGAGAGSGAEGGSSDGGASRD